MTTETPAADIVEQIDREAAAVYCFSRDNFRPDPEMRHRWDELGERSPLVRAFAKHAAPLRDEITRLRAREAELQRQLEDANVEMRALYRGYINTLENGRDRIVMLGGGCDPVERMEEGDPALRRARQWLTSIRGEVL